MDQEPAATPKAFVGALFRRHGTKLFFSLVLGLAAASVLSRGGLPLVPPIASFQAVKWWAVFAFVVSLTLVHLFRAIRWRHLLARVGTASLRNVLVVSWIGFGAILLSPLRSGEVVRPYLITKRSDVRIWEATGTVGAERVIDGVALSFILFVGLRVARPLSPLPDRVGDLRVPAAAVPGAAYGALALFMAAFALMGLFFFARGFARRLTRVVIGTVSVKLAERVALVVERVADGLAFLPSLSHLGPFLLETMAYWTLSVVGTQILGWGCGLDNMTLAQAAVTLGCVGIGILVPSGPGFFGAFQLSTYMALAMYFEESKLLSAGAAFVFLYYVTQVGVHIVAMAAALALDRAPAGELGSVTRGRPVR
jgi:uncharacterized protein (TIRG00374 family)